MDAGTTSRVASARHGGIDEPERVLPEIARFFLTGRGALTFGVTTAQVARALGTRLVELEEHYRGEHPIAMGIEYLERARARP